VIDGPREGVIDGIELSDGIIDGPKLVEGDIDGFLDMEGEMEGLNESEGLNVGNKVEGRIEGRSVLIAVWLSNELKGIRDGINVFEGEGDVIEGSLEVEIVGETDGGEEFI